MQTLIGRRDAEPGAVRWHHRLSAGTTSIQPGPDRRPNPVLGGAGPPLLAAATAPPRQASTRAADQSFHGAPDAAFELLFRFLRFQPCITLHTGGRLFKFIRTEALRS